MLVAATKFSFGDHEAHFVRLSFECTELSGERKIGLSLSFKEAVTQKDKKSDRCNLTTRVASFK